MKRCASFDYGAFGSWRHTRRAFTLLEMCMVLLVIVLLLGVSAPAIQSAFMEQAVRNDSRQLALMVKTAMLQSSEQHRPYVIDLTSTNMALHPMEESVDESDAPAASPPATSATEAATWTNLAPEDVAITSQLDPPNKLLVTDPDKPKTWIDMPASSWVFQPGELCPATTVRMTRGDAWVELNFNALTGNVENEKAYIP